MSMMTSDTIIPKTIFFILCLHLILKVTKGLAASPKAAATTKSEYDLLVIGGGSAGLTAAKFAATFGKSVAIIENAKLGGDCTWYGCIPSKSLIASSKAAHAVQNASKFGINTNNNNNNISVDMKAVKQRIQNNMEQIYEEDDSPEAMNKLGIDTIFGTATFQDTNIIRVDDANTSSTICAKDGVLICTGASPKTPNIPGLIDGDESINYITYENAFDMEEIPELMTVIGGGPIGVELAQAYSRLGSKVTIIANTLLPREEPEVGECLQRVFEKEGIRVVNSKLSNVQSQNKEEKKEHLATCQNGETVTGDLMLLALGRKPVVNGLGLSEIGVEMNQDGGIQVDNKLQTSVKGIYAAGDCTGDRQFTHYAGYQGAIGARNILLPFSDPGMMEFVPGTTFTDPQIASVGLTEEAALKKYKKSQIGIAYKELKETDRGICDGVEEGFIKVVYLKKGYKVLGASIVSPVAGELISEITTMMKSGMSFDMLATVMHTYPSHSFALQAMAAELYYDKLVKLKPILNFLKRIGL